MEITQERRDQALNIPSAIRIADLDDIALDYAVTKVARPEGLQYGVADWREQRRSALYRGEYLYRWSYSWEQGGPLIETLTSRGPQIESRTCRYIGDMNVVTAHVKGHYKQSGPTILIAGLKCYLHLHLGDEIAIPEELFQEQ
jgi:hypothetical protein